LIVEQIEDSRLPERVRQRIDVVANHSSLAIANAMEHQSLFLMPLWRTLGKSRWLIEASRLPKTIAISIAVFILILGMFIVPWDFELESNGTLEPVLRSEVFALETGNIKKVLVRHGQGVKKGELLAEMTNVEVGTKLREIEGNLASTYERLRAQKYLVYAQRDSSPEDRNKLLGEIQALKKEKNSLDAQLVLYSEKYNDLKVISPRAGQVVTWDIENLLDGRPVQRGQVLMQVADTSGAWQLELQMPEDRMGYLIDAQEEMGDDLKVTFVMATDPGNEFVGKIKETHYSAEVRGEEGNTVLVKVDISEIDPADLPNLMPGAEVKAKVYCGQRSIAYCLFHDLWAFIQSRILFRF
jgi:multidrug efflux pump subunit AcrA (membrane-fusion protein)